MSSSQVAQPAVWKYSANKVLKSIINFSVVIYKTNAMFLFPFPVQFSVNILKKLNIQSLSIMQLVKTAAEFLQCIPKNRNEKGARDRLESGKDAF